MEVNPQKHDLVAQLRIEVQECFGKKVLTYGDSLQLSEEIFVKTTFHVSPNTLGRFFGLVKTNYLPSILTLNILAKYCGFTSVDDFQSAKREKIIDVFREQDILNCFLNIFKKHYG